MGIGDLTGHFNRFLLIFLSICFFAPILHARADFDLWLYKQAQISEANLLKNISPSGTRPGAVIASPSRQEPDYFFHWVRDAALVMDVVRQMLVRQDIKAQKAESFFKDFLQFTKLNQSLPSPGGLGEPKYHVDGTPYIGPWGRPQNDGPALRALTLIRWSNLNFKTLSIRKDIWPVVLTDLDYVVSEWKNPSFDLWEEIMGDHYYTRSVQYAALTLGAKFAEKNGDNARADKFQKAAAEIWQALSGHYSVVFGYFIENLNRVDGIYYKSSGVDVATLLAVLHTYDKMALDINDARLKSTVKEIESLFANLYLINQRHPELAAAIGRYPEDRYYGGNPWFLTTAALAEYNYKLAYHVLTTTNNRASAEKYISNGDRYMQRIRFHIDENGSMAEQMDRFSGFMTSARDLTWSYASFLTAYWARKDVLNAQTGR